MNKKISYNAIRWLCIAMMGLEVSMAYSTRESTIFYSLHSIESTLWLLAFVYFLGKDLSSSTMQKAARGGSDE